MSDDITFCASECDNKDCFRHPSNIKEPHIPHSFAYLKGTEKWCEEEQSRPKITRCDGEGQGSCKRCVDKGKWNRMWMCFLYEIDGYDGCYCSECVREILKGEEHE